MVRELALKVKVQDIRYTILDTVNQAQESRNRGGVILSYFMQNIK